MLRHTEGIPTLVTFVRLLTRVSPHVYFQIVRLSKCLSTSVTFIRLITCVHCQVVLKMAR